MYYFSIEDESILAEAFSQLPQEESFAISYKVVDTEGVFVTTAETRDAMDRTDVPYTPLAEEDANRIALYHSALSKEELAGFRRCAESTDPCPAGHCRRLRRRQWRLESRF